MRGPTEAGPGRLIAAPERASAPTAPGSAAAFRGSRWPTGGSGSGTRRGAWQSGEAEAGRLDLHEGVQSLPSATQEAYRHPVRDPPGALAGPGWALRRV